MAGLQPAGVRDALISLFSRIPGRGDYLNVTPFALHFGWLHHKEPFYRFADRVWKQLTAEADGVPEAAVNGAATDASVSKRVVEEPQGA